MYYGLRSFFFSLLCCFGTFLHLFDLRVVLHCGLLGLEMDLDICDSSNRTVMKEKPKLIISGGEEHREKIVMQALWNRGGRAEFPIGSISKPSFKPKSPHRFT